MDKVNRSQDILPVPTSCPPDPRREALQAEQVFRSFTGLWPPRVAGTWLGVLRGLSAQEPTEPQEFQWHN